MQIDYTLSEISEVAAKIIKVSSYKTLLFYGEMGAGKTTLIKEIVKQIGSPDKVSSPTFSLVNEYQGEDSSIYHFDFHRIENEEEAYDIGFEEYIDSGRWCLIEWPQHIESLLPLEKHEIHLSKINVSKRELIFK
ncbi:tRNA (adenosine(37)-N6)-threonylcarbamoyltransferase complex ATPase subunit type 1 TsaE [Mesonia sp. MT50]|uniref:tRNA threonylcarbamoyladenosine biosynthesis protein TsaE n=1 Tax=Mesonia profundi TaxID=3070998 RepID=A0ABU1A3Q6_9FLAO|nr:tRNA (adenosine(37)-N6)-threonylcarbamoyltransferase complex ATPase subunit type 1 TsaE [Mesonia profundi]MDQ7918334.1 tRNA (adenosine(37)-N6)-threonylcarbamoyltransferase complex ATPase subunit type 1 TsaE [Mesonia profundi]